RMRFCLLVIEKVRAAVGRQFPIEIRISGAEIVEGGYDIDEGVRIAEALDGKVDLIHVSAGHHEDDAGSMVTHPTMFLPDGVNVKYAAEIKKHVKTPVATVGALADPAFMEEIIASGQADVIELGRQTLADPDLPIKARMGRDDDINQCMRCFNCFSCSSVNGIFYCATNPKCGHELENKYALPPRKKKTVLIAGGGIGGMQATLTCAEQGHKVILCEKTDKLGGALLCEHNVPFKQKLRLYLERQARLVNEADIDVRMNTAVTPEYARAVAPDVIIAAMGSRPIVPKFIKGWDNENVVGAEEVYYNPSLAGENNVILGGGLVGLELGLWLAKLGKTVTIVEMAPSTLASKDDGEGTSERMFGFSGLKYGDPFVHGIAIAEDLKNYPNMTIRTSTKALEIGADGVKVEGRNGVEVIPAETVIYAVGQKPLAEEASALYDCAPEFHQIGDCVAPRNIMNATSVAYQIARDIGRY
ncbi:MAG: FAD-dependent oxidoreductase, partial [Oscillospiraceae bacterium]|nr:FAD-dependent oxidoreductase [Oscillospiraceae bacterium]